MTEMTKAMFLLLSKLIEDEETQVHGVHVINNLEGVALRQASHITPSVAKRSLHIMQVKKVFIHFSLSCFVPQANFS